MVKKRIGGSEIIPSVDLTPEFEEDNTLDWQNRLVIIGTEYGFLPATRQELTRAMVVIPFLTEKGWAAKHLNEIVRHYKDSDNPELPTAAARSVVTQWNFYRLDAAERFQRLDELYQLLDQANPELTLEVAGFTNQRALIDVAQFLDVFKAAGSGDASALAGGVKKLNEGQPNEIKVHHTLYDPDSLNISEATQLQTRFGHVRVAAMKRAVGTVTASQYIREQFWLDRQLESLQHWGVRKHTQQLLDEHPSAA